MKLVVLIALAMLVPLSTNSQIPIASDVATNYGGTWTGDQGTGFGAWVLEKQFEVGDGIAHAINSPGDGIMGSSWRMSANRHQNNSGTPIAAAFRELDTPLQVGETLSIRMKHGPIAVGGKVALYIRNGNDATITNRTAGTRLELSYTGGASTTIVNDEGTAVDIGFNTNAVGAAVRIDFTLTSINTYNLKVTDLTMSQEYTLTGRTLAGVNNHSINSIALVIEQAQTGDVYFNNLSVTSPGTVQISAQEGWRMMASPVSTSLSSLLQPGWTQGASNGADVTNGNPNVYTHDGSTWQAVTNLTTTQATAGSGFIYYHYNDDDNNGVDNASPTTFTVAGSEFAAPGTMNFTNGGAGASVGWNLLGNPFASTIDWDAISPSLSDVDGTVYVYTNVSPDEVALGEINPSYIAWNGTTGSLTNGLIAPFQGFFVKAGGVSASLALTVVAKSASGTFRQKDASDSAPTFALRLSNHQTHNDSWFGFTSDGLIGRDRHDAFKLEPLDDTYISLFSVIDGIPMDIQNLPASFNHRIEIPISMKHIQERSGADGDFTLSLANLTGVDESWGLTLMDHETDTEVDLRTVSHRFRWTAPREKLRPATERMISPIMTTAASEPRFTLIIDPLNSTSTDNGKQTTENFRLEQNYPNPFNPSTVVGFRLSVAGQASLKVYDVLGREVAVLVNGVMPAGAHSVNFDASNLTSGVYLYKLEAGGMVQTKRMTLVK